MHNASFDLKMLFALYGKELELEKARIADTQAAERVLRNGRKSSVVMPGYALKTLAERYAGMELDKNIRQGFYGIQSVEELSDAELHYAERDVEATWKVFAEQLPMLERDGLMRAAAIEGACCMAFSQLEYMGAPIDKEAWQGLLNEARTNSAEARKSLEPRVLDRRRPRSVWRHHAQLLGRRGGAPRASKVRRGDQVDQEGGLARDRSLRGARCGGV